MRKLLQHVLVASMVLASATTVYAQRGRGSSSGSGSYYTGSSAYGSSVSYGTQNEIITNFTSGSLITGKTCKTCPNVTNISLGAAYLRTLNSQVQAGALARIRSISGGGSETLLTLQALGVYNFDPSFKQSFFVQGAFGIVPVEKETGPGHESKFGFMVGGGKRFPLWGDVNYIPTASIVKNGDLDIGFDIEFLNFSLMF